MYRIMHGNVGETVVVDALAAGIRVARMVAEGKTNILITREDSVVTVTQIDRPDPKVPVDALTLIRYDVVVQRG